MDDKNNSIVLYGSKFKCSKMCKINMVIRKKNTVIIKGNVFNENQEPSIGAAIEVKEISCDTGHSKILGYCFTNYEGEYAFSLQPIWEMRYEISIYSPLITD